MELDSPCRHEQSIRKGNRSELRSHFFLELFLAYFMNNYLILYKHKIFLVLEHWDWFPKIVTLHSFSGRVWMNDLSLQRRESRGSRYSMCVQYLFCPMAKADITNRSQQFFPSMPDDQGWPWHIKMKFFALWMPFNPLDFPGHLILMRNNWILEFLLVSLSLSLCLYCFFSLS